jgi:hypothetical protein
MSFTRQTIFARSSGFNDHPALAGHLSFTKPFDEIFPFLQAFIISSSAMKTR